jgi:23S rRNA pseudouridine1911/1915/1917 synthase
MLDAKHALTTTVKPDEDGLMIKEIVYGRLNLSRGLLRRMKRGGGVYLNGQRDYLTRRVRSGDQLQIFFYDEDTSMEPEAIPLEIVYEDDYLLIVNKPAGMAVHPTGAYQQGTLANAIAHHWKTIGLRTKVRLVHRIDRETSGLILVTKEPYSLQRLLLQLSEQTLIREYLAIVEGQPKETTGIIRAPIGRSMDHGVKRAVRPEGKEACTVYETLRIGFGASLLRVRLESGRTHQIRVHLASLGHPLLGDPLYNKGVEGEEGGQALHAWRLEFVHPRTGKKHEITCPLPREMLALWKDSLEGGSAGHARGK